LAWVWHSAPSVPFCPRARRTATWTRKCSPEDPRETRLLSPHVVVLKLGQIGTIDCELTVAPAFGFATRETAILCATTTRYPPTEGMGPAVEMRALLSQALRDQAIRGTEGETR
jgi:hypothetical protein